MGDEGTFFVRGPTDAVAHLIQFSVEEGDGNVEGVDEDGRA